MHEDKTLANGLQEVIFQRCLAIGLKWAGVNFAHEVEQMIYYEGIEVEKARRLYR